MNQRKAILVMGAGDATGGAIAKRFAREGYVACVARRHADKLQPLVEAIEAEGGTARAFGCDARVEEQVQALFATIEQDVGPLEAVVFNIGANVQFSIGDTTERVYRKVWEMAALAGFLTGREAARVMQPRARGTIIFTGATASLRGRANFSAFAGAKFALRALAQSMARELGPQGIHVAHPIIDGAIDTAFIRETFPELYQRKEQDGILNPEHIAETYWQIHCQPRDCWVHELDLRPWTETF
ncbi:short-chain dehydrogenase [Pseudomonas taeanensis MS-3]|jgi:NAD(P)-dependent dehydrogenase (short-subunit alcohol dehydrogenase family)|uniref:Short-chain dehydrogenase n=1 Tax=Pseudomonas taeanensis MS-3 TaxID=1395571 RepID=A0A0A1YQ73_9PSED|nr:SDR family oxidoreductase [Pseudomonas taeanensis]KFX71336.1 short-chain dehydrogenase [Pseudomonas taeanensis MS-3]